MLIEEWRKEYNPIWLHSSLELRPPAPAMVSDGGRMKSRRSDSAIVLTAVGCVLAVCPAANAQPLATPYAESAPFVLNTNRIGFADSGLFTVTAVPDGSRLRAVVSLGDPMPNPFNALVTIPFHVGRRGLVELKIYDLRGRRVRTLASQAFEPGSYAREWDGRSDRGSSVPSGVYVVRVGLAEALETRKICLVK